MGRSWIRRGCCGGCGVVSVSAIIVTRGDQDLTPIWESLPPEWEKIEWNNGRGYVRVEPTGDPLNTTVTLQRPDLSVYGRYAAIEYASHDLIYVQDDDVIVENPGSLVEEWDRTCLLSSASHGRDGEHLVANMPPEFRHDFYTDHCLVGFGAVFHRDAPARAFERFIEHHWPGIQPSLYEGSSFLDEARRTADVVFTALTPRVLVDVPKTNLPWAEAPDRMYRQPGHLEERTRVLEMARKVRDA